MARLNSGLRYAWTMATSRRQFLASLALLVSIATLYLTFLRKKSSLIGCIAAVSTPEPGSLDDCMFDFALSNTGTLELLIREVTLDIDGPGPALIPEISTPHVPVVPD